MALYTYVPPRTELLDLMVDTVLRELAEKLPDDPDWRAGVRGWASAE